MNRKAPTFEDSFAKNGQDWYCLRSQPKREHIAARNLKSIPGIELFNPRLRTRKLTARGPVWFTESLFPNYLFARFQLSTALENVKFTAGVSHVLRFGDRYPFIPDSIISELKKSFGEDDLSLSADMPNAGDTVILTDPKFHGLEATVLRIMPAKQRVQVLLDILGQSTSIELSLHSVMAEKKPLPASLVATM